MKPRMNANPGKALKKRGLYLEYAMQEAMDGNAAMKTIMRDILATSDDAERNSCQTAQRHYVNELESAAMKLWFNRISTRWENVTHSLRQINERYSSGKAPAMGMRPATR